MSELQDRIVQYVTTVNSLVSLEKLLSVATAQGFSEGEVLAELGAIDKKLKSVVRGEQVYYTVLPPKKEPKPQTHLQWIRDNYPPMDSTNDGSGIDIGDLSWMFLRTKEERDAFKAEMSGKPVYMKKKYAQKER